MRLNLHLRTAHRVLWRLAAFPADNPNDLYAGIREIPWEELLHERGEHAYLSVTATADTPSINDTRFVNVKTKDAIVDRLAELCGMRPDSGPDRDRAVVHVYWQGKRVLVYLDTSGEPLSRRGYRKIPLAAPMQETLAAAVILATGWNGRTSFVNPMCGSGTLAIEAALFAQGKAPGLLRSNYGFIHLKGFDPAAWRKIRAAAHALQKETAAPDRRHGHRPAGRRRGAAERPHGRGGSDHRIRRLPLRRDADPGAAAGSSSSIPPTASGSGSNRG